MGFSINKKISEILFPSLFASYCIYERFMEPELTIPLIMTFVFAAFLVIFHKSRTLKEKAYDKFSCALFACFMVLGDSLKEYNSLEGIFGNPFVNSDITEQLFEEFAPIFGFLNGPAGNVIVFCGAFFKLIGYYYIIKLALLWLKRFF